MADGDLAFFRPARDDAEGRLVADLTRGPYCHVGVRVGSETLSAQTSGVVEQRLGGADLLVATGVKCLHLADALTWLMAQVGKPYSYAAVVQQAIETAWDVFHPTLSFGPITVQVPVPPLAQMFQSHAFDCSSLATRFLIRGGYPLPAYVVENPDILTPNALARMLQ